jgi:hypothetical protein
MTVPAFIGHTHEVVALVAKLGLVGVAIHTGTVEAHKIGLIVGRPVGSHPIADNRSLPVLQECFVIGPDVGLRLDALLFVDRKLEFGSIACLSTRRIVPERGGDEGQEDQ